MPSTVEFWFEFASSYSYVAAARLEALAEERGCRVRWRPFLLGPIFSQQGWADSPFNLYPAKGRYMWRDMERTCERLALSFQRPSVFPRSGLLAARVACGAQEESWLPVFVRRVFQANFARDEDISSEEVLGACLAGLVDRPDVCLAASRTPEAKERLRAQTAQAQALGIFGAPTLRVGEELFWGSDRLQEALDWASAAP